MKLTTQEQKYLQIIESLDDSHFFLDVELGKVPKLFEEDSDEVRAAKEWYTNWKVKPYMDQE